jgi:hypothetical protein
VSPANSSRIASQSLQVRDPWLREWHATRAVRRNDERLIREIRHATRASMWLGPVITAVAIYLTMEEVLSSLFRHLLLALP